MEHNKFLKSLEPPMGKPITVRLPIDVQLRYDSVKKLAENNGLTFSTTEIFVEAVRDFCDYAENHLANIQQTEDEAAMHAIAQGRSAP